MPTTTTAEAIWTFNSLMIRRHASEQLEICEFFLPAGFSPPWHVHREATEVFYVLEGEIRFQAGDDVELVGPGGLISLPVGVPHSFYVESDGARALHTANPGVLWDFHAACGRPADDATALPPAEEIDVARVLEVAARHEVEILGPPLSAA